MRRFLVLLPILARRRLRQHSSSRAHQRGQRAAARRGGEARGYRRAMQLTLPNARPIDQVRDHRRQRPRLEGAARSRGADGRLSPALRLQVRADGRRQHLRRAGDRGGLPAEVRGAVQAAARRRREVLRGARQPRRHQPDLLQAVQHGRQALLHVRAAGRSDHALGHARALLRARQHLSRSREQMRWFEKEATESRAEWKIAFLHHPVYTSGRYALAARGIRFALESAFVNGGVDVVFSGHEHIYERAELQHGILYFITGGAGSLRAGDASPSPAIARGYDQDYHFMLAEITRRGVFLSGDQPRSGVTVDAGIAAAAYCGHDGPSVTCLTLALKTRTHSLDRRRLDAADQPGRLIEARAAEQIVDLLIGELRQQAAEVLAAGLGDLHRAERRAVIRQVRPSTSCSWRDRSRSAPSPIREDRPCAVPRRSRRPATSQTAASTCRLRASPSRTGTPAAGSRSCCPSARGTRPAAEARRRARAARRLSSASIRSSSKNAQPSTSSVSMARP